MCSVQLQQGAPFGASAETGRRGGRRWDMEESQSHGRGGIKHLKGETNQNGLRVETGTDAGTNILDGKGEMKPFCHNNVYWGHNVFSIISTLALMQMSIAVPLKYETIYLSEMTSISTIQ